MLKKSIFSIVECAVAGQSRQASLPSLFWPWKSIGSCLLAEEESILDRADRKEAAILLFVALDRAACAASRSSVRKDRLLF